MSDKRTGWLTTLKVGDEVGYSIGRRTHCMGWITAITARRSITLRSGRFTLKYDAQGDPVEVLGGTVWFEPGRLCQATDKVRREIERRSLIDNIEERIELRHLPLGKLRSLWAFVKEWSGGSP